MPDLQQLQLEFQEIAEAVTQPMNIFFCTREVLQNLCTNLEPVILDIFWYDFCRSFLAGLGVFFVLEVLVLSHQPKKMHLLMIPPSDMQGIN